MTVHALHIFDRKGKTLFTKFYSIEAKEQQQSLQSQPQESSNSGPNTTNPTTTMDVEEQLSEQRKLVFGLLFSLRELVGSLGPDEENEGDGVGDEVVQSNNPVALHSVRTGASTLHNYETLSGLRFAMYTDNNIGANKNTYGNNAIRDALRHIYTDIWVECVIRSPLYRHGAIPEPGKVSDGNMIGRVDIKSTLFEKRLDEYLMSMPWFK